MLPVLKNPTIYKKRYSTLQKRYLQSRKPDSKRVVKHEQSIQNQLCAWFKQVLPGEHFISDTGSGAFNSDYAKVQHNRQQSHKHEPDIKILAMRRGYGAMVLELKADSTELRMKRNGTKIRVRTKKVPVSRKYPEGIKIIERDYKIRKKGDWASLHLEQQAEVLLDYERKGYFARFAVGLEHAKKLISWYFDLPYTENSELF